MKFHIIISMWLVEVKLNYCKLIPHYYNNMTCPQTPPGPKNGSQSETTEEG